MYFGACWHRAQYGRTGHRRKPGAKYGTKDRKRIGRIRPDRTDGRIHLEYRTAKFSLQSRCGSARVRAKRAEADHAQHTAAGAARRVAGAPRHCSATARRARSCCSTPTACTCTSAPRHRCPGGTARRSKARRSACRRLVRHGDVPAPDGRRRRHRNRSPGPTTGPSHCRWACARAGRCRSSTKRASCSARSPSITARRAGRATRKPNCCATSATASASRCTDRIARQLARSEEHHRLVVNSLNEGIVVVSRDGVVVASNPSANRMMRVKGDLVGRRLSTVILRKLHEDGTPIAPDEWPSRRALETATPMLGYTVGFGGRRHHLGARQRGADREAGRAAGRFGDRVVQRHRPRARSAAAVALPRDARCADGPLQPPLAGRPMRELFGGHDAAAARASRSCSSISSVSRRSTTRPATTRATRCCAAWPRGSPAAAGADAGRRRRVRDPRRRLRRSRPARGARARGDRRDREAVRDREQRILARRVDRDQRRAARRRRCRHADAQCRFGDVRREAARPQPLHVLHRAAQPAAAARFAIEQSLRRALSSDMLRLAYQPSSRAAAARSAPRRLRWTEPGRCRRRSSFRSRKIRG